MYFFPVFNSLFVVFGGYFAVFTCLFLVCKYLVHKKCMGSVTTATCTGSPLHMDDLDRSGGASTPPITSASSTPNSGSAASTPPEPHTPTFDEKKQNRRSTAPGSPLVASSKSFPKSAGQPKTPIALVSVRTCKHFQSRARAVCLTPNSISAANAPTLTRKHAGWW